MCLYKSFFEQYNYDVRLTGDARWIDQKCTYDVLSIIADCIIEYTTDNPNKEFTVSDIWRSQYAIDNVQEIFSKPDPSAKAGNEYDKYFGQPIKLLGYSKVLNVRKEKNKYFYTINNRMILEKIAFRPTNALNFLYEYITKVLTDSGIIESFNAFFDKQNKNSYKDVRNRFIDFTIQHTKINGQVECGRIFTKVINPLAFKHKKLGTEKGRLSNNIITMSDLQYNRYNWRDELSGKDKSVTRGEYQENNLNCRQATAYDTYTVNKAKRAIRKFNDEIYSSRSEVIQGSENVPATQAHHIFPQSEYPEIAAYVENLIMLTPNQHYSMAHPNNNTQYIDRDFQYVCLLAKTTGIYSDLVSEREEKFYDFDDYKYVLNIGLETEKFSELQYMDFAGILEKIDCFYLDTENSYQELIAENTYEYMTI